MFPCADDSRVELSSIPLFFTRWRARAHGYSAAETLSPRYGSPTDANLKCHLKVTSDSMLPMQDGSKTPASLALIEAFSPGLPKDCDVVATDSVAVSVATHKDGAYSNPVLQTLERYQQVPLSSGVILV